MNYWRQYDVCIIVHDTQTRSFTAFDTVDIFIMWYDSVMPLHRTFDEVIRGPRKFIIDIDCKNNYMTHEIWNNNIQEICSRIRSYIGDV